MRIASSSQRIGRRFSIGRGDKWNFTRHDYYDENIRKMTPTGGRLVKYSNTFQDTRVFQIRLRKSPRTRTTNICIRNPVLVLNKMYFSSFFSYSKSDRGFSKLCIWKKKRKLLPVTIDFGRCVLNFREILCTGQNNYSKVFFGYTIELGLFFII